MIILFTVSGSPDLLYTVGSEVARPALSYVWIVRAGYSERVGLQQTLTSPLQRSLSRDVLPSKWNGAESANVFCVSIGRSYKKLLCPADQTMISHPSR